MGSGPPIIGIEGPVCAGKTTLLHAIGAKFPDTLILPEYYEMLGKKRFRNLSPKIGLSHRQYLLGLFRGCEQRRHALISQHRSEVRTVVLDRTFFSVACWHYASIGGKRTVHLAELLRSVDRTALVIPEKIYFMDIPHARLMQRARAMRFDPQSPALSANFTRLTRQFFAEFVAPIVPVCFIPHHQLLSVFESDVLT
ncbi:hypothetical protein A6U97_27835 [Agrobacterium tumefaciens]|uniref:AAA family ATPase n=1 Tax=Agrobacterium tumefaciens TaxID=358 RepID=UPI00080F7B63|nr:hypothetical protein A6U97_27835 [Agrobacterium tumefaciens]